MIEFKIQFKTEEDLLLFIRKMPYEPFLYIVHDENASKHLQEVVRRNRQFVNTLLDKPRPV